jgi:hypothetical protein
MVDEKNVIIGSSIWCSRCGIGAKGDTSEEAIRNFTKDIIEH